MRSLPINTFASLDPNNLLDESKSVIKFISNYYENIEKHPVQSQVEPGYLASILPSTAPYYPESLDDILDDVTNKILPGITHWQSPNFFGYFQANASTAGFLGEMLCSGLNVVGFNWIASPAATELESVVMDWLGNMLKLPSSFLFSGNGGGVLHGSTCEALLCTLVAARDRALNCIGEDKITKLVVYASDQTHFSLQKTAKLIGISSRNIRALPTSSCDEFALSPATLRLAIEEDVKAGLVPLYLCATIGTTATGAIDPIKDLGNVAKAYNLWFHVDAAYAGSACICPEFRHYLDGIELGDSFSMNSHKWLLTNMECCCLWLQNPNSLIQSLSTDSEITKYNPGNTESNYLVDYKDWQIALSRRFKAIKLWLVIRKHGVANLMYHIRSDIEMAKAFEDMVKNDPRFEIVVPRRFALVCFRLRAAALTLRSGGLSCNDVNKKLLESVNASGRGFMTHGVVGDVYFIRCAIGTTLTEMRHVKQLWILVQESTQNVCI